MTKGKPGSLKRLSPYRASGLSSLFAVAGVLALVPALPALAGPSEEEHKHVELGPSTKLDQAMRKGSQKMESVPMTGNIDQDFARMMIPHHQAAIEAARIQLQEGQDPEMKRMAERNIRSQERDIAKLQAWLKKKGTPAG